MAPLRTATLGILGIGLVAGWAGCGEDLVPLALQDAAPLVSDPPDAPPPPASPFAFATVFEQERNTVSTPGYRGDLWPSCWSDDGALYAANGDGGGYGPQNKIWDIAVNKITGTPEAGNLAGQFLAGGDDIVGHFDGIGHNRKPGGMFCVNGDLYISVRYASKHSTTQEAGTIAVSHDKGKHWTYDHSAPMFPGATFTSIFFLDFGKDNQNAIDGYVYAYGLDSTWSRVHRLYLARVPKGRIQDRSAWSFFESVDAHGTPHFARDIAQKQPVLADGRSVHADVFVPASQDMGPIAQGSVVFNKPLNRYIYTSWTEPTHEFYEAPHPWGPWSLFHETDFGTYPWSKDNIGGYASTIPSKFISRDGRTMWLQSNCFGDKHHCAQYFFSLRKVTVRRFQESSPTNERAPDLLSDPATGATPIFHANHYGNIAQLNDGKLGQNISSWTGARVSADWWGYTWPRAYWFNRILYTTGTLTSSGGWFRSLKVQVRQNLQWVDVEATVSPDYPSGPTVGSNHSYTFTFADVWGDGIRIIGPPGGSDTFTTVGELSVSFE
jgi:hypothetical protein